MSESADPPAVAKDHLRELLRDDVLPKDEAFVDSVLARCYAGANEDVAHHAVRTFAFASLLIPHLEIDLTELSTELLFAACVLHDVGLSKDVGGTERFEVLGADTAVGMIKTRGFSPAEEDQVWEAIALHAVGGIAERRGAVTRLTRAGVTADFGAYTTVIDRADAERLFEAFPRNNFARSLAAEVHRHVAEVPSRGPRYSFPGETFREIERGVERTEMEIETLESGWDREHMG